MGTLSEELAATIIRNLNLARVTAELDQEADLAARRDAPPTWSWTPGTFVFPEGLCCYCGGVMASPAIWRTDNLQFLGSWKVAGEGSDGYFVHNSKHPHVLSGAICMGSDGYQATSVADALFLAFNPLSMYFQPVRDSDGNTVESSEQVLKAWFADRFNHRCGENSNTTTIDGIDNRHVVAPEAGCHCQHCRRHRGEMRCDREGCGEWYAPGAGHGEFACEECGSNYCIEHRHDRHRCVDCDDSYDNYDIRLDAPRPTPEIKECGQCEEWVCIWCLGEGGDGTERSHECDGDEEDGEDTVHECCDCDTCCDCGAERDTEF